MANFDWLTDLNPLLNAQEPWMEGSYQKIETLYYTVDERHPFAISCGAGLLAEHIRRFRFSPDVIQRLGQVSDKQGRCIFHESFLNHLQRLRLRMNVLTAPEGTLLLPNEPLLIVQGPRIQHILLESAFRLLIWESTHWATQAALYQWNNQHFTEEDSPEAPAFSFNREGWKKRAIYIGGGTIESDMPSAKPVITEEALFHHESGKPLVQIRRAFKGEMPLGDVWMTPEHEHHVGVSRSHIEFQDMISGKSEEIHMTRYQNLFQPVLLKGHPVLQNNGPEYLRQRMWKQLEAFHSTAFEAYPRGWYNAKETQLMPQ